MTLHQMLELLDGQPAIEKVGVVLEGNPSVLLHHKPSGLTTQIPISGIDNLDEKTLLAILSGEREPKVLRHMTRIVGYFSNIHNWNDSKLGELRDRRKGNYSIESVEHSL